MVKMVRTGEKEDRLKAEKADLRVMNFTNIITNDWQMNDDWKRLVQPIQIWKNYNDSLSKFLDYKNLLENLSLLF